MIRAASCLIAILLAAASALGGEIFVTGVELSSPHRLPEALIASAIGELAGKPFAREAVRSALVRVWSLGLFSSAAVEEVPDAGGIRLRFLLARRPHIVRLAWAGDAGLPLVDVAEAAGLAVGGDADPAHLEKARQRILARYRAAGYLAPEVEIAAREEPETNGRDLTIRLAAGPPATIILDLRGAEGVAAAKRLRLASGDRYVDREIRDRLRALEEALHADGFYGARVTLVETAPDPAARTIRLVVDVAAGPRYRVEFAGHAAIAESFLRSRLTLAGSRDLDVFEVEAEARRLEAACREAGHPFARVRGLLLGGGEEQTIRFSIEEGPAATVERVDFTGNRTFPARRLHALIETRPAGFWQAGRFRQDLLDRDTRVVLAFYRSEGFPEAVVGPPAVEFDAERTRARITIPIVEGPRVLTGEIRVEGAAALSPGEIVKAIPLAPGDPWSAQRAEDARRAVERLYARHGYLTAHVTAEAARREDRMDLTLRVREGGRTRIGRILFGGLLLTEERVVRRELPFAPGDPFDPERIQEAERRLAELGIFERVQVGPPSLPSAPFADVDVTVREGKPWRLDLGVGYSTDEEWRGFLEVGHDNLFGTGQSATARETVATKGDRTDLAYRSRRLFDTAWQGEATLYRENWKAIGYRRQTAGGTAGIQRTLFPDLLRGLRGLLSYRLDWVRRFDVDPSLAEADVLAGTQLVASLTPALALDRRNDPRDPTRGSSHLLSLELGAPPFGSEVRFVKFEGETRWFLDWLAPSVLAFSGRLGLAAPYGGTPALDIDDRFKAGGSATIRGYPEDRVGPLDSSGNPVGGNGRLIFNAEWRFPVWRWLGGVLFVDSGTVAPKVADLRLADFKTGVGGGLRVKTPVGPLRVDVGYALNTLPTHEDRWQLYFSIGHSF